MHAHSHTQTNTCIPGIRAQNHAVCMVLKLELTHDKQLKLFLQILPEVNMQETK